MSLWTLARNGLRSLGSPGLALAGVRVRGRVPTSDRPMILACNHAAYIDTVYLHVGLGEDFVVCGAKPRLFRSPPLRALMKLANVVEVADEAGFFRQVQAGFARGERVLVYPEMGRRPQALGPFVPWFAVAARQAGALIVPIYLYGTSEGHSWPVEIHVGQVIEPRAEESAQALNARVREAIVALMP